MAAAGDYPGHRYPRHPVHGLRRHQGRQPDSEAPNDRHDGRHGRGRDRHRRQDIRHRVAPAGGEGRRGARPDEYRQLRLRPQRSLQLLVRHHRRLLLGPVVLRHRPIAGAALPYRSFRHREPARSAVQRIVQDSDAGPDPLHRRAGLRLLRVRSAPCLL